MKRFKLIIYLLLFSSLFLVGCKDKDNNPDNPELDNPIVEAKSYIFIGGYTTLKVTNYSIDLFDIIIEDPTIVSLNEFMDLVGNKVGKTKVTFIHKEYSNVQTSIEIEVITQLPVLSLATEKIAIGGKTKINIRNFEELIENSLNDFTVEIENKEIASVDEDFIITGLAYGGTNVIVTSKLNPLINSSIYLKVANPDEELVITCEYLDGSIKPGTAFELELLTDKPLSDFSFAGGHKRILRIREDNSLVAVEAGTTTITVFEKANPKNSASYTFFVEGESEVDYIAQFLDYALAQNAYVEGPDNHTKFGEWYNLQNEPWCAMFVSWCWYYCGLSNDIFERYCSCSAGKAWCEEKGIFKYKENYHPKTGDIVYFLSAGMGHTGIALYADEDYLYTIEGNSSNKVGIWRWSLNDARITGYGVPEYPDYDGVRKDYSWVKEQKEDGSYWWSPVAEKQPVT